MAHGSPMQYQTHRERRPFSRVRAAPANRARSSRDPSRASAPDDARAAAHEYRPPGPAGRKHGRAGRWRSCGRRRAASTRSSIRDGTSPPKRSRIARAAPFSDRVFWRKKPVSRIRRSIRSAGAASIARASGTSANRRGVTWFTRLSVHCAERIVATRHCHGRREVEADAGLRIEPRERRAQSGSVRSIEIFTRLARHCDFDGFTIATYDSDLRDSDRAASASAVAGLALDCTLQARPARARGPIQALPPSGAQPPRPPHWRIADDAMRARFGAG